jgi:predicted nucleic acid-binding protein
MELVVDANIIVAGFMKAAVTRELLLDERLTLSLPEYGLSEARKVLCTPAFRKRLGGLTAAQVNEIIDVLTTRMRIIPAADYIRLLPRARILAAHAHDAPYLALALHLQIGLWSNDGGFREQSEVVIITTRELIKLLSRR